MLDIKYILENADAIKDIIKRRNVTADLDGVLTTYAKRKALLFEVETKRAEANQIAKKIPQLQDAALKKTAVEEGRALNHAITALGESLRQLDVLYQEALMTIPNCLAEDTPDGQDDLENVVLRQHGTPRTFAFKPRDHVELGKILDCIDFDSGAKVTGAKFYFLKNDAVMLELALKCFAMQTAREFGYTPLITPDLAKKSVMTGTGFSPRGEESNIYNLEDLDLSLIATAEITVAGIHADELLDESQLPFKYVAESHCFRREAGSAGRESKGLYRVHQLSKIELFQITKPEDSETALNDILHLEETIYQRLGIPYRVVRICSGDLGASAYKKYDIEAWMPGRDSQEKYGEVTSASNCTDYQARRLNMWFRNKDNQKTFPHTLNGTAIALSRTLIAILENYQREDGSVEVPEVLRPIMGKDVLEIR